MTSKTAKILMIITETDGQHEMPVRLYVSNHQLTRRRARTTIAGDTCSPLMYLHCGLSWTALLPPVTNSGNDGRGPPQTYSLLEAICYNGRGPATRAERGAMARTTAEIEQFSRNGAILYNEH